jgi:hypothetical protein
VVAYPIKCIDCYNIISDPIDPVFQWKKRLTIDEINKIEDKTHEIASQFYSEADWDG